MATLQATKILEALQKAKRVGRVEDEITIDGCALVMQNLAPEDYDAINRETEDLDELQFLHAYQIGHVCRSIVEVEGHDLRNTQFIEDTVPDGAWGMAAYMPSKEQAEKLAAEVKKLGGKASVLPPESDSTRTIKLERHEWIRDNFLSSWGREAIVVAWRKFAELLAKADAKAKEGIQFTIPDETPEERFRRLMGEIKEVEEELPPELVQSVLDDFGYIAKSTAEELEAVNQRMRDMAAQPSPDQKAPEPSQKAPEKPAPAPEAPSTPEPQKAVEKPAEAPQKAPGADAPSPADLMKRRTPMSKKIKGDPIRQEPTPAPSRVEVPEQIRRAAEANAASLGRSAKIAALEAQADPTVAANAEGAMPRRPAPAEVAELTRQKQPNEGALSDILDRPPPAGINPRFKPPPGTR